MPERNVITVVSRSRTWVTGQRLKFDKSRDLENGVVEDIPATPATPVTEVSSERPHRVAITGHDLHRALEKIFSSPISIVNNVWVWPFKHFVTYEAEIKQCLEEQTRLVGTKASDIDVDGCNTVENGLITAQNNKSEVNINTESGTKLRDQLRCLVHFMDNDMREIFAVRQKIADGTLREIAFDHLWQLFSPGDAIFSNAQVDSQRRAFRVLHVTGGRTILDLDEPPQPDIHASSRNNRSWERHGNQSVANSYSKYTPFIIDCFYLDFDGQSFGPVSRRFIIQEYEGERSIESLPAFPMKFDKNWRETEKQLIKRGKRFVKLAGVTHNRYIGLSAKEPSITESQDEVPKSNSLHTKAFLLTFPTPGQ